MKCQFTVNGRTYRPPARPVVVVCIDGSDDDYLTAALGAGRMPNVADMVQRGYRGLARGALPSFTNVNNACIVTGVPPNVTGITGNYFLDPDTGREVMMNSSKYLRCPTILAAAAKAGRRVAMITAKDKLRDLLSADLRGIAFSAEKAGEAVEGTHGVGNIESLVGQPTPDIYSADASLFVVRAGTALLERDMADFLYLSLTDYVQHGYEPAAAQSLDFYEAIDHEIGRLMDLGAVVAATADHGMNAKTAADGSANVIYLETLLQHRFGTDICVICPITDPYVAHHGSLGSLVMVHLPAGMDAGDVANWLTELDGITEVYDRATAVRRLELPADRIGDLVVLGGRHVVLGRTPEHHDLRQLQGRLRSHGGRCEEIVPMLISEPLHESYAAPAGDGLRNFDVFSVIC